MILDLFKGVELYQSLKPYTPSLNSVCKEFSFISHREYDVTKKEASWWFNPKEVNKLPISHVYPQCLEVQKDPRLCLNLYIPNYVSLLVINELYEDKNILIEDQAAGMGRLLFYLNKLGYNNFNAIESFDQLPEKLFMANILNNNIPCVLNDYSVVPEVVNLVGYTEFPKKIKLDTNLVITYNNVNLITKQNGDFVYNVDHSTAILKNKVFLCKDNYDLTKIYCNKEKYEEFKSKLEKFEI